MHSRRSTVIHKWILRHVPVHILVFATACTICFASSRYANRRSCEVLSADAIFIGRVIATSPTVHRVANQTWPGYSIRFAVEEVLKGKLEQEVTGEIGSGCGGCGEPPEPGKRLLVFAIKGEDGLLWTGNAHELQPNDPVNYSIVDPVRKAITLGKGSLYGNVTYTAPPVWDNQGKPVGGGKLTVPNLVIRAASESNTFATRTAKDGTYEFKDLPNGRYIVTPELERTWTYDQHFFAARYEKSIGDGSCAKVDFDMYPTTRLKGRIKLPPGQQFGTPIDGTVSLQDIVAVPTGLQNTNERSGFEAIVFPDGQFDIWPIPAGDYYLGINITKSPTPEMSYAPTYYPGVTDKKAARVIHLEPGEVKSIEFPAPKFAPKRLVRIEAMGLDGKPLRKLRVQREDLQYPGDATNSIVDVDLDENGVGTMYVFAGITYHLHPTYVWLRRTTWCAAPVLVSAGSEPMQMHIVMDTADNFDEQVANGNVHASCAIGAMDKGKKDLAIAQPLR